MTDDHHPKPRHPRDRRPEPKPQAIVVMHGIPGSGKSTVAKKAVEMLGEANTVYINRDDIRTELFGEEYHSRVPDKESEGKVNAVHENRWVQAMKQGKHIVSDNTNLTTSALKAIERHAAKNPLANIEHIYMDVPIEECKRRNKARAEAGGRFVPEHVIDKMAKGIYEYGGQKMRRIRHFDGKPKWVSIQGQQALVDFNEQAAKKYPLRSGKVANFDMDGTLADVREISDKHLASARDFHSFHTDSEFSPANERVLADALEAYRQGLDVTITTARNEAYAEPTINWLNNHGVPVSKMFMRKEGDFRPDYEVKEDIYQQMLQEGITPVHCWDDNPQAVKVWQNHNIPTTVLPFHSSQEWEDGRVYEPRELPSAFQEGKCLLCSRPLKNGTIGPKCLQKQASNN